jgi:flagellar biosynthesis protein FlhB
VGFVSQGEEKTEAASEFRLKQARKKGQVAKSADVVALASLCCVSASMLFLLPFGAKKITTLFIKLNNHVYANVQNAAYEAMELWFILSLPVLLAALLGAVIGNVSQFGFLLSSHPIKLDFKRVNPISGLKKLFSKDRLVELGKQLVKFTAVFWVIYSTIKQFLPQITMLARADLSYALSIIVDVTIAIFLRVILCFLVIAIFDWFWARYSFLKSMRMSKYEVKKEYQQQEGDPHIKQERQRRQQETLEAASAGSIDHASVVITNPSHLAVAISYNEQIDEVPRVLAKGIGRNAKLLIEQATKQSIPIIRNVPLVRDLQWLEINEEIPQNLYDSVAEVLLFVHELTIKNNELSYENQ